jgi:hypothetical protein
MRPLRGTWHPESRHRDLQEPLRGSGDYNGQHESLAAPPRLRRPPAAVDGARLPPPYCRLLWRPLVS